MAIVTAGTTSTLTTGGSFSAASQIVTATPGPLQLLYVEYYLKTAGTYLLKVDELVVARLDTAGALVERFTPWFDTYLTGSHMFRILRPGANSQFSYDSGTQYNLGFCTLDGWEELDPNNYRVPWIISAEDAPTVPPQTWETTGAAVVESVLLAVPGVVVNGASDTGGGTAYEPPTTGRVYPSPDVYN